MPLIVEWSIRVASGIGLMMLVIAGLSLVERWVETLKDAGEKRRKELGS